MDSTETTAAPSGVSGLSFPMTVEEMMSELDELYAAHPPNSHRYSWLRDHLRRDENEMDPNIRRILKLESAIQSVSTNFVLSTSSSSSRNPQRFVVSPPVALSFESIRGEEQPGACYESPESEEASPMNVSNPSLEIKHRIVPYQGESPDYEGMGQAGSAAVDHPGTSPVESPARRDLQYADYQS
jgi:hypothetical protein